MHGAESTHGLADLESWFQSEIVRPHETRARRSEDATSEVILPSRFLAPRERVAIYSRMYFLRLQDCLREDYPALARFIGERPFEKLVRAYLREHPSRHYSLNVLGRGMPEFLAGQAKLRRRALLAEVARLERSIASVFDAPASPAFDRASLARLGAEAWESARVRLVPALELHAFEHRTNAVVTALRQEKSLPDLARHRTWTAVYRKDFVVWRMDLTEPMHAVLHALADGANLRAAIEAGATSFEGSVDELRTGIAGWFGEWAAEGFFASVDAQ